MKTILEFSPKGDTLWEIPDEIYPVIEHLLETQRWTPHPFARSRTISVGHALAMLPNEFRVGITAKSHQAETRPQKEEPKIEFFEIPPISEELRNIFDRMESILNSGGVVPPFAPKA